MSRGLVLGLLSPIWAGALLMSAPALAYTSPGSPTGYVNDLAHVLSEATKRSLESEMKAFEASTTNEIAVVTIPNMGGDYIENYAVKLFEEWSIGKRTEDNGVLLLLANEERKLRIEVGYGLEGALPDSVAERILDNEMTPRLRSGDYDGAITAGVRAIQAATRGEYRGEDAAPDISIDWWWIVVAFGFVVQWIAAILARSKSWWAGGVVGGVIGLAVELFGLTLGIFGIVIALCIGVGLLLDYLVSNAYRHARSGGTSPPWWAGGGSTSGGGGGFGGFGGGSSGGGGASGGW